MSPAVQTAPDAAVKRVAPAVAHAYRDARARKVSLRRERALARIDAEKRVDPEGVRDPLAHERRPRESAVPIWVIASVGMHAAFAIIGALAPQWDHREARGFDTAVEIIELPPPPRPPPQPPQTPPITPPPDRPIEPVKPVVQRVVVREETPKPKDEPPPDPTEAPPPTDPTPQRPVRRIVGLNLGSTATGGSGPAFGIGNTRMGETSKVAEDPNGAAGRAGTQFTPPRRTHEEQPDYPPSLRAKGVEGEVGLKVDIDASGKVSAVVVVVPSPENEFNKAALVAAWRGVYQPAVVNGAAVANTIQFTVRFRLRP